MEGIDKELKQLQKRLKDRVLPKEQESPHCDICKDVGYIFTEDERGYEIATLCKCEKTKRLKQKKDRSGLGDLLDIKTLDNYIVTKPFQKVIKQSAIDYLNEIKQGKKLSFSILGQSGVGKSHILIAVSKALIEQGLSVRYYIADEIIQRLNACKYDDFEYTREFNEIVKGDILYIDDLFKSSVTNYYQKENIKQEDLREIFKIINYRYNKGLPILLSSEIHFERFGEIDQAIIGRVNEMCNYKYCVSVRPDPSKNYRLTKS